MWNLKNFGSLSRVVRICLVLMLFPIAAVLGHAIAHENWIIVGAILFIPVYLTWPVESSLGVFAFLVPFDAVAMLNDASGTTLSWLAGAVAGAGLLTVGIVDRRLQKPPRSAIYWALFLGLGAASILWAYNPDKVLEGLQMLVGLFLLYITAVSLRISERELSWVTTMAVAGGVLASIMAISGFYSGVTFSTTVRSTLAGDGRQSDPNIYAAGLLLPMSLAVGRVLSVRSTWLKMLMALAAGVIMLSVLLTMSRGALLAVFVMIAIYALRYRLSWKILIPVVMLLSGLAFVPDIFFSRLQDAAETGGAGRLDIWIAGLHALKRYAFFGAGLANFSSVYTLFAGYAPNFTGYARDAHNIYLAIAVELGLGGLALMLLAIGTQLRDARPHKDAHPGTRLMAVPTEAACWAILVSAVFLNLMYRKSLWLVLIMVAISVRARQQREDELRSQDNPHEQDFVDAPFVLDTNRPITTAALAGTYRRR